MSDRVPVWLYFLFGLQFALAALFLLLGWSQTVSLAQGRPAALVDIVALSAPALLVALCAVLAVIAWRKGSRSLAALLLIAPLPASFLLFTLVGAI